MNYTNRTFGIAPQQSQNSNLEGVIHNIKSPTASMFGRHDKRARSIALNPIETEKGQFRTTKGGSPGGMLLQEKHIRSHLVDDNQTSIVDFIKKNLNIAKEKKNIEFEKSKELINRIYNRIKKRKEYALDQKNLFNLQSCLPPKLKNHFMMNQGFLLIFSETNVLNQAFSQIIDQVCCYRLELGLSLQKLVESYNSIILTQFEEFYKAEVEKEKDLIHKMQMQQKEAEELYAKRLEFDKQMQSVSAIIQGKDAQIQSLQMAEEQLEQEVKYLREMMQIESGTKKPQDQGAALKQKDDQRVQAKEEFSSNIEDLTDVLKSLEQEQNEKKSIISGLDKLVKTMLKTTKESVGTQVEEGELQWKPQNYLGDSNSQIMQNRSAIKIASSKGLLSETMRAKEQNQSQIQKPIIQEIEPIESQLTLPQQHQQQMPVISQLSKFQYQSPMEEYANSQKVLQMKEEDRIADLESKLNSIVGSVKHPESDKPSDQQLQWSIPSHVLIFIANSLEENQSGRVLPWQEFKTIIFDIYDHRINNSSEINGVINTTYMNLEEYILIYFLDKYKLRRLAEIKIIETLTSLKYYLDIWPRAKMFATLLNFLRPSKHQNSQQFLLRKPSGSHQSAIMELSIPNVDIYLQEFYLHAYSILLQDKEHFLESKDGQTFVKISHEETATQILMTWFGDQDTRKWFHKVRRNVKKIKSNALDDFETDYIDMDILLNMYVEEFKQRKKTIQKNLSKEFMKRFQEQEGLFSTEEIDKIVQSCIPAISPSSFVKYPGVISIRRAFLYALVCGENGFEINTQEFIAGCNRFGIDNPSPIVTKKLSLYGNDDDIEDLLKKELVKANIQIQAKMHTTKQHKVGIKIESARLSATNIRQQENQQNSPPRVGIQNLKLMGRVQTADNELSKDQNIIAGGVKLSIGQLGKDLNGDNKKVQMTNEETSIGNKKILIPSFSTTSALFSQHFSILRDLKKRIEGLKQAYYNQREEDRSWEQVEKILHVLEAACKFLDFPIQT